MADTAKPKRAGKAKSHTEIFKIARTATWAFKGEISVKIECDPLATIPVKLGLAVKASYRAGNRDFTGAVLRSAVLRSADLSSAVLRYADLRSADLRYAVLSSADLSYAVLRYADLSSAVLSYAVLRSADLRSADLRYADLSSADLSSADLSSADLSYADLSSADLLDAPKIENIHQTIYAAASAPGALKMSDWHCGTSHCRAGWAVELAGAEGKELESRIGTPAAATLIYLASDPTIQKFPNFYCGNEAALADMKAMAEAEAARVAS